MTQVEYDECYEQLISNCAAEAKRLTSSSISLEELAIKAILSGNHMIEAVANEAIRIAVRSK